MVLLVIFISKYNRENNSAAPLLPAVSGDENEMYGVPFSTVCILLHLFSVYLPFHRFKRLQSRLTRTGQDEENGSDVEEQS